MTDDFEHIELYERKFPFTGRGGIQALYHAQERTEDTGIQHYVVSSRVAGCYYVWDKKPLTMSRYELLIYPLNK